MMSETRAFLKKLADLRSPAAAESPSATCATAAGAAQPRSVAELEDAVAAGFHANTVVGGALRRLTPTSLPLSGTNFPNQLTPRAHRLLVQARDLTQRLHELGDEL